MIDIVPVVEYINGWDRERSQSAFKRFYMAVALSKMFPSAEKLSQKYLQDCYDFTDGGTKL